MTTALLTTTPTAADERAARADLRAQVARLERAGARAGGGSGPRLLGFADLEALRDELARPQAPDPPSHHIARARLEAMLADPAAHRHDHVALRELGRPGCGSYVVRPRLGLIGMLAGWWEVKLSSGCP